ncbi:MAG: diguanylate cyclase domain-containing protein [Lachnospiraceae bacterium]
MGKEEQKRLNVGVIMGNLDAPHAFELAGGMTGAAKDQNVNLLFYPGMYAKSYYETSMLSHRVEYDYQNTVIFDYIDKKDLDVLIISMGTVKTFLENETEYEFLQKFEGIPCIILEDEMKGYPCITINNRTGLEREIRHLIVDHGLQKIAFVSGNKGNFDATERLQVYLNLMEEYHLPVTDQMIAYGEFTEYTDEMVGKLLDDNPGLQAICFANDMMALGGYRECKRRGLKIGKDIALTGFDDYVLAMSQNPPLTTVRVSAMQLGTQAVYQAIRLANGEMIGNVEIPSTLIIRRSCGCSDHEGYVDMKVDHAGDEVAEYAERITMQITERGANQIAYEQIKEQVTEFVRMVLTLTKGEQGEPIKEDDILVPIRNIMSSELSEVVAADKMYIALDQFIKVVLKENDDPQVRLTIVNALAITYGYVAKTVTSNFHRTNTRHKKNSWYGTFITRDTMLYSTDEREALYQMILKLQALQYKSAYIYLFQAPIANYNDGRWKKPDSMFLAAYFNRNEAKAYEPQERPILSVGEGLEQLRGGNERYTAVSFNLFSNEEQYGVLVCEIDIKEFSFAYTISLQIGSALKFLELMRKQMKMQKQLEASLDTISRKNDLLSQLSVSDELTKLLNRRGLFERIGDLMSEKQGMLAAIVFIDMDNLKGVNDTFGHNEGDFALQSIADILRKCFRPQDPIGRIGGDEFAAFAIVDEPGLMHGIRTKIDQLTKKLNDTSGKPYYVEMSVGIKEFVCTRSMNLNEILKEADALLYDDKKKKRKSCVKGI